MIRILVLVTFVMLFFILSTQNNQSHGHAVCHWGCRDISIIILKLEEYVFHVYLQLHWCIICCGLLLKFCYKEKVSHIEWYLSLYSYAPDVLCLHMLYILYNPFLFIHDPVFHVCFTVVLKELFATHLSTHAGQVLSNALSVYLSGM